jgi:hypothetical protein
MKLFFLIIINLFCIFYSVAQCTIISTCGYTVEVSVTPISIVPSSPSCPWGYNYNVTFNYSITVTGSNTCYNGNIGIQPQIFCNGGQNNGYYTINIPAPTVGAPSASTTYNGTLTTTSNQYRNLSDCNTATPSSLGCNSINITIYGPGISTQTINCNQSPLPIDLLSFKGECNDQDIVLKWVTLTEKNNDYFTIEKSLNAINWEIVAQVNGAGNSNSPRQYKYNDKIVFNQTVYYRLKQTDFDGTYKYFDIIAVNCRDKSINNFKIYPNPFYNQLTIEITDNENDDAIVEIMNKQGSVIFQSKFRNKIIIPTNDISDAIYIVRITTNHEVIHQKVLKQ